MKRYRNILIVRIVTALAYLAFGLVFLYRVYVPKVTREFHTLIGWPPFYQYVLPGMFLCFIIGYSLYVFFDSLVPLLSEKHFKTHYVRDTDERLTLIKVKSGTSLFRAVFFFETVVSVALFPSLTPVEFGMLVLNLFALLVLYGLFRLYCFIKLR